MENELLESWKEISSYLGWNIRTCQYWEKKHGLPVHRLVDSPKARVFAYKKELDLWLQDKLHKAEPSSQNKVAAFFRKNRLSSILALAFFSFGMIAILTLVFSPKQETLSLTSAKPSVLIMPFTNNSGDIKLDHFSWGLTSMCVTDLSQSRYVSVVREDELFTILLERGLSNTQHFSSKDLADVARQLGATQIIRGSYIKLDQIMRIDVDIIEVSSMESGDTLKCEAKEADLATLIDDLTKRIKSSLNLTDEGIGHDIDERVGQITTESADAYRLYIEGRNYHNLNEYEKSIDAMEKALAIDPGFSLALRSISESYYNLGRLSKSREYAERALVFRDRLTERDRYHFELLFFSMSEENWDKAIAAGEMLVKQYPGDIRSNDLADLYSHIEHWDKAIAQYQVLVENQELSYFPYAGLSSAYEAKGLYNKALKVLNDYLHDISEHYSIRWRLAFLYMCQGKYDLALEEAEKLSPWNSDINGKIYQCLDQLESAEREYLQLLDSRTNQEILSAFRSLGSLYLLQGRYDDAEHQYLDGIDFANSINEPSWIHGIRMDLAYLYLAKGNFADALRESQLAVELAVEEHSIRRLVNSLHLLGLIYVGQDRLEDAEQTTRNLETFIKNGIDGKLMRFHDHLIGEIEFHKGAISKAIEFFKRAVSLLPSAHHEWYFRLPVEQALFLGSLAASYDRAGNLDSALKEYSSIANLTIGKLWYGDKYRKALYRLGEIHERMGQNSEALRFYERYATLLDNDVPLAPGAAETQIKIRALKASEIRNSPQ